MLTQEILLVYSVVIAQFALMVPHLDHQIMLFTDAIVPNLSLMHAISYSRKTMFWIGEWCSGQNKTYKFAEWIVARYCDISIIELGLFSTASDLANKHQHILLLIVLVSTSNGIFLILAMLSILKSVILVILSLSLALSLSRYQIAAHIQHYIMIFKHVALLFSFYVEAFCQRFFLSFKSSLTYSSASEPFLWC